MSARHGTAGPRTLGELQLRQGDVLLLAVDAVPAGAVAQRRDGRLVLAHGEATGHAHAIEDPVGTEWRHQGERYLQAPSAVELRHEEHAPIQVPPGAYQIVIQREFDGDQSHRNVTWRYVVD